MIYGTSTFCSDLIAEKSHLTSYSTVIIEGPRPSIQVSELPCGEQEPRQASYKCNLPVL